jgi:membrane protease YdiL (CAAX protease family)
LPMESLKQIFLSPDEPRLRAGWRLLIQTAIWFTLTLIISIPALILWALFPGSFDALNVGINALAFIPSVLLARRFIDRRSIESLGLTISRRAAADVLTGIGIGGALILFIYLIQLQFGWLTFTGFAWEEVGWLTVIERLVWWGFLFLLVGFYEELFSRGYQLQNLEEGLNLFWAVLLSSGFFGLMHIINPGATWVSTLGVGFSGLFFAFTYLRTRQLWLPIGIHIGWNFFEGPVFGFPVSGLNTGRLLVHQVSGPELWTGGPFGPEAGLVLLPGLMLGFILVAVYTNGRLQDGREEAV